MTVLPELDRFNTPFWTGGADGRLLIFRCRSCALWQHPPTPLCRTCGSMDIGPEPVSGRGVVHSFTVNEMPWAEGSQRILALVELEEQESLRLATNVIDCEPDAIEIGMPVVVTFHEVDDVHLPLFRPEAKA